MHITIMYLSTCKCFRFSYLAKNFGESGAAENSRCSNLHVLVLGRVWPTIRLGKAYSAIIIRT